MSGFSTQPEARQMNLRSEITSSPVTQRVKVSQIEKGMSSAVATTPEESFEEGVKFERTDNQSANAIATVTEAKDVSTIKNVGIENTGHISKIPAVPKFEVPPILVTEESHVAQVRHLKIIRFLSYIEIHFLGSRSNCYQ